MRFATKAEMRKRVAELGASIDSDGEDEGFLLIDAPVGFQFCRTGTATLSVPFGNAVGQQWRREAYADAISDMSGGIEPASQETKHAMGWQ